MRVAIGVQVDVAVFQTFRTAGGHADASTRHQSAQIRVRASGESSGHALPCSRAANRIGRRDTGHIATRARTCGQKALAIDHVLGRSLAVSQHHTIALVVLVVGLLPLVDELVLDLGVLGIALHILADGHRTDDEADNRQHDRQFDQRETLLARCARTEGQVLEYLVHDVLFLALITGSSCRWRSG